VAPRYSTTFPDLTAPRVPSFNEVDVSDKPVFIRNKPPVSEDIIKQIDTRYRNMAKSVQAADEWVGSIVNALAAADRLEDSYIFFLSDNGWMSGQHRLQSGKGLPYEESLRMALHVRGPAVPHGVALDHLISNADLAPTVAQLAGVALPSGHDGRSFAPVISADPPAISAWRKSMPTFFLKGSGRSWPGWKGVRTNRYTYTEWTTGERELYDNLSDQFQLRSLHAQAATATLRSKLASLTSRLATCTGETCRNIEDEEVP
jgi:arylsulfatase A-like enzyme